MIWKNTIEPLDDEIIHSENPISGIVASHFHMIEPSNSRSQSLNFNSVNVNIVDIRDGNQVVEIENADNY